MFFTKYKKQYEKIRAETLESLELDQGHELVSKTKAPYKIWTHGQLIWALYHLDDILYRYVQNNKEGKKLVESAGAIEKINSVRKIINEQ